MKQMGVEVGDAGREESSERRRDRVCGWVRREWMVVRRRMAVVSLPAVMLEVVHAVSALGSGWVSAQCGRWMGRIADY